MPQPYCSIKVLIDVVQVWIKNSLSLHSSTGEGGGGGGGGGGRKRMKGTMIEAGNEQGDERMDGRIL